MNKQLRNFSLLIMAAIMMAACAGTDSSIIEGTTSDGFRYTIHKAGNTSTTAAPTEYVYFKAGVLLDDTLHLQPLSDRRVVLDASVGDPLLIHYMLAIAQLPAQAIHKRYAALDDLQVRVLVP